MKLTKEYIAGFTDGEGYIGIEKKKDNRIKRGYSIRFRIELVNQYKELLEAIQKKYGGRLWLKINQKQCWQLTIERKQQVFIFLKDIAPFLIVKKEKAMRLIGYIQERKSMKGRGKQLSKEELENF